MEQKLNIAEILKDKPQGTKLYDLLRNIEVELDSISYTDYENIIWCRYNDVDPYDLYGYSTFGTERGWLNGLQILLPSKEMHDWRKFAWNTGDILVNKDGNAHVIFKGFDDDTYETFNGNNYLWKNEGIIMCFGEYEDELSTSDFSKANKEDAQTYIKTLEEYLDGKLNLETLEIEKQLEFKDGDIVVYGKSVAICRKIYKHTLCFYVSLDEMFGLLFDDEVESSEEYRFATEEEKLQLFNALLAKKGKTWDVEKKMIVDLKPKYEFKPFDKVLVRNTDTEEWFPGFFEKFDSTWNNPYHIMNLRSMTDFAFKQCISYEGNEHLLDTTDK